MKTFSAMLLAVVLFAGGGTANGQVSINVNIGSQPAWGPVGYDHVDYYYLPDIDAYYYVPDRQFIYFENNNWVRRASLPPAYRGYDLYSGYKVVVNQPRPYLRADYYRVTYGKYKGWKGERQIVIRDKGGKHDNGWHGQNPKRKGKGHH